MVRGPARAAPDRGAVQLERPVRRRARLPRPRLVPAEVFVPSGWRGQRVFLRVGSANYAAKVWVNGAVVAEHLGGHLPFVADVTDRLVWDRENVIAIAVENKQLLERVPPAPGPGGGGVAGVLGGYPLTTYDFFPYAGLHRPVRALLGPGRRAHRRRHGRHDDRRQGRRREGHGGRGRVRRQGEGPAGRHRGRPDVPRRLPPRPPCASPRRGSGARRTRTSTR